VRNKRVIAASAVALIALTTGCSVQSTDPDQAGLHYKGGPLSSKAFANCQDAGTRKVYGPGDHNYAYPIGQRTYRFEVGTGQDSDNDSAPFEFASKDNVEMTVSGVATFDFVASNVTGTKLNDAQCAELRRFHEQIGLKYHAYNSDGWATMLDTYVGQPLKRSISLAGANANWRDLYNNQQTNASWERQVSTIVPQLIKAQAGDDYFKNFRVTLQKPKPPQNLLDGLAAKQAADLQNQAQAATNAKIDTEIKSIQALIRVLGVDGYIKYKALQEDKVNTLILPDGQSVAVPRG
jgi:hypothetical protein